MEDIEIDWTSVIQISKSFENRIVIQELSDELLINTIQYFKNVNLNEHLIMIPKEQIFLEPLVRIRKSIHLFKYRMNFLNQGFFDHIREFINKTCFQSAANQPMTNQDLEQKKFL